jgi:hypothetical protein
LHLVLLSPGSCHRFLIGASTGTRLCAGAINHVKICRSGGGRCGTRNFRRMRELLKQGKSLFSTNICFEIGLPAFFRATQRLSPASSLSHLIFQTSLHKQCQTVSSTTLRPYFTRSTEDNLSTYLEAHRF